MANIIEEISRIGLETSKTVSAASSFDRNLRLATFSAARLAEKSTYISENLNKISKASSETNIFGQNDLHNIIDKSKELAKTYSDIEKYNERINTGRLRESILEDQISKSHGSEKAFLEEQLISQWKISQALKDKISLLQIEQKVLGATDTHSEIIEKISKVQAALKPIVAGSLPLAVLGAAAGQMAVLNKSLKQASTDMEVRSKILTSAMAARLTTGATMEEIADASKSIVSYGQQHNKLLTSNLRTVAMLNSSLDVSTEESVKLLSIVGTMPGEFDKVADAVAAVSQNTALSAIEATKLAQQLGKVNIALGLSQSGLPKMVATVGSIEGTFKQLGGDVGEFTNLVTKMQTTGGLGQSALLTGTAGILDPKEFQKKLTDPDFIRSLSQRASELTAGGNPMMVESMSKFFGMSSANLQLLINNSDKFAKNIQEANKHLALDNYLADVHANQQVELGKAISGLLNMVEVITTWLASPLISVIAKVISTIQSAVSWVIDLVSKLSKSFGWLFTSIQFIASAILGGLLIKQVVKLATMLYQTAIALNMFRDNLVQSALATKYKEKYELTNPIQPKQSLGGNLKSTLIGTGIALATDGLLQLWKNSEGTSDAMKGIIDTVQSVTMLLLPLASSLLPSIVKFFGSLTIASMWSSITAGFSTLLATISGIVLSPLTIIAGTAIAVAGAFEFLYLRSKVVSGEAKNMGEALRQQGKDIGLGFDYIREAIWAFLTKFKLLSPKDYVNQRVDEEARRMTEANSKILADSIKTDVEQKHVTGLAEDLKNIVSNYSADNITRNQAEEAYNSVAKAYAEAVTDVKKAEASGNYSSADISSAKSNLDLLAETMEATKAEIAKLNKTTYANGVKQIDSDKAIADKDREARLRFMAASSILGKMNTAQPQQ